MPLKTFSPIPLSFLIAAALSLTACQQENAVVGSYLPKPVIAAPLFDNSVTLVETAGSRALNDGIFYTATDIAKAKAAFTDATLAGVPNSIRAVAYREYAKIMRFEQAGELNEKSLNLLFTAHKLGDPQATRILADYALTQGREAEALALLQPIYQTYTPAKALLGQIYLTQNNPDGARLIRESIAEYQGALALGDAGAHIALAELFGNPALGQFNPVLAVRYYEQARAGGDEAAYFPLAEFYRTGSGVVANHEKAIAYYTHIADAGNANAARILSSGYSADGWIRADAAKEVAWMEREEALRSDAFQPAGKVRMNLGKAYTAGYGVKKNLATARIWFDKAAAEDAAMNYRAMRFLQEQNTPEATALAEQYYQHGLAAKDPDALAYQVKLAEKAKKEAMQALVRQNRGDHKFQSLTEVETAARAMRANPEIPTADRYFAIGDGYVNFGKPKEGLPLLERAAGKGSVPAMKRLSRLYAAGDDVDQDFARATQWMLQAAKAGDVEAEYYTGLAYAQAIGVEKDVGLATHWLSRASVSGNANAKAVLESLHGEAGQ
jgi:uncharacterized protein